MRDFFNPLGSGDVKQVALLLSYLQRFFLQEEVEQVFKMITDGGAKVLSIKDYGIKIGSRADITVLDALSVNEVIAYQSQPVFSVRAGTVLE
jgi:cytosine deaminase